MATLPGVEYHPPQEKQLVKDPQKIIYQDALLRLQKVVFKNRIRVKEFVIDFDPLRSGFIKEHYFVTALSIAGLDRYLTKENIQALTNYYSELIQPNLSMINWKKFTHDVDQIFTQENLERDPLSQIQQDPQYLVDKYRFEHSGNYLGELKENKLKNILQKIKEVCSVKRILVKNFFDDAWNNNNSPKLVGHVTQQQFRQCFTVKLGLDLRESDVDLIVEKFSHPEYKEMVNYLAFANTVDPPESSYNCYKLR